MDPITLGIILGGGALLGLGKSEFIDKPKEARQRKLAAEKTRYSPWTGLKADPIQEADPVGSAMQFGTTAGSMYSGLAGMQGQAKLNDAMTGYYSRGGMGSAANQAPQLNSLGENSFWDQSPQFGMRSKNGWGR